jgi:hypothetical protein
LIQGNLKYRLAQGQIARKRSGESLSVEPSSCAADPNAAQNLKSFAIVRLCDGHPHGLLSVRARESRDAVFAAATECEALSRKARDASPALPLRISRGPTARTGFPPSSRSLIPSRIRGQPWHVNIKATSSPQP